MPIGFNNIPGSGLVAPIFTAEVNSGGQFDEVTRLVLQGFKTSAGSLALNTPTPCGSLDDATRMAGAGSMLRAMFRVARMNAPAQSIWIEAVAEVGVAPTWTLTCAAPPAAGGVGYLEIGGETIAVSAVAGDTATTLAAALAAAVNGYYDQLDGAQLPVTATAAAAVVTLTARHLGAIMAEVDLFVPLITGNIFSGAGLTIASVVAASGVPSLAAAHAALGDDPADFIVSPWSDAGAIAAHYALLNDISGRWAWSRQTYGHIFAASSGNFAAQTTLGLTLNDRHLTLYDHPPSTVSPSWQWAAAQTAAQVPWLSDTTTGNVSRSMPGKIVLGVKGPRVRSELRDYAARNTLNASGISTYGVGVDGLVKIEKAVTTYRTGNSGQPDSVFRDVQALFQVSGALKFIRAAVAQDHGQKAIADANPGNLLSISTPADIKATFIHAYAELERRGVLENSDAFSRLLEVRRNASNPNRVDIYAPLDLVNRLDILAVNATVYPQFPADKQ